MNSDGFDLREAVSEAIALLLAMGWYFLEGTRVNIELPCNRKGLEQNHESRVLSGR